YIASLKFMTSIAGLGSSIVFALMARLIVVSIERSFSKFCETAERQLLYTPPQSITVQMHEVAKEQRDQLKELNSDRYFSQLADTITPLLEQAIGKAMSPVTEGINNAVEQLRSTSQSGVETMAKDFAEALHGNAGVEMKGMQDALRQMQKTMAETHQRLQGGGEDFSRRLSEAAENLSRLVNDASGRMEASAEQSRSGLAEVLTSLKQTLD